MALKPLPQSMVKLATQTPSGVASVTFAAIPGGFSELVLEIVARGDNAATNSPITAQFNGDSGANYDRQNMVATGAAATEAETVGGTSVSLGTVSAATAPAGCAGYVVLRLPLYAGTTFRKSGMLQGCFKTADATSGFTSRFDAIHWRSTAAITQIVVSISTGNFVAGSTFTLWGVV